MCDFKLSKLPSEMNALVNWACPVVFSLIVSFVVSGIDFLDINGKKFAWLMNFSNLHF